MESSWSHRGVIVNLGGHFICVSVDFLIDFKVFRSIWTKFVDDLGDFFQREEIGARFLNFGDITSDDRTLLTPVKLSQATSAPIYRLLTMFPYFMNISFLTRQR